MDGGKREVDSSSSTSGEVRKLNRRRFLKGGLAITGGTLAMGIAASKLNFLLPGIDSPKGQWTVPTRDEVEALQSNPILSESITLDEANSILAKAGIKVLKGIESEGDIPKTKDNFLRVLIQDAGYTRDLSEDELIAIAQAVKIIPYAGIFAPTIVPLQGKKEGNFVEGKFHMDLQTDLKNIDFEETFIGFIFSRNFITEQEFTEECYGPSRVWKGSEWLRYTVLHEYGHGVLDRMGVGFIPPESQGFIAGKIIKTPIFRRFAELDGWEWTSGIALTPPRASVQESPCFQPISAIMDWVRKHPRDMQRTATNYGLYKNFNEAFAESWAVYHMYPELLSPSVRDLMEYLHNGFLKYGAEFISIISANPEALHTYKLP